MAGKGTMRQFLLTNVTLLNNLSSNLFCTVQLTENLVNYHENI